MLLNKRLMNIIYSLALLLFVLLFTTHSTVDAAPGKEGTTLQDSTKARSVYVEGGGAAGNNYSINYDIRFGNSFKGWGVRVGAGFLPARQQVLSVPVQLNYLAGNSRHFLEMGGGLTFYHSNEADPLWGVVSGSGAAVFGALSAGYRYQPRVMGLTVRGGVTGLFGGVQLPMPVPQLSVGYRF